MTAPSSPTDSFTFSHWHAKLRRVAPKATVVRLPPAFVRYLDEDGIVLPRGSDLPAQENFTSALSSSGSENDEDEDEDEDEVEAPTFPELDAELRAIIDKYDGAVFPKLGHVAPQDAAFMLPSSSKLRCQSPADVYLLLKASDAVARALHQTQQQNRTPELVLKKWFDMPRANEWRLFIKNRRLLALSQRDTAFYDFLLDEDERARIKRRAVQFVRDKVLPELDVDSFTLDIYFARQPSDKVFAIDLAPLDAAPTLLFDADELQGFAGAPLSDSHVLSDAALDDTLVMRTINSNADASQHAPAASTMPQFPVEVGTFFMGGSDERATAANESVREWAAQLEKEQRDSHGDAGDERDAGR